MADPITNLGQIEVIPQIAASKFLITDANGLPTAATAEQLASSHEHSTLSAPDGSPSPAVSVDDSGRLGVATTSPTGQMQVEGHTFPLTVLRHTAVGEVYDENASIYIEHKRENLDHGITDVLPTDSVMQTRSVIGPLEGLDGGIVETVVNTGLDTQFAARTLKQISGHLAVDTSVKDGTNTAAFPDASTMVAIQNNGVIKAAINGRGALKIYGNPAGAEVSSDPLLTVSSREVEDLFIVKDNGSTEINAPQASLEDPIDIIKVAVDGGAILKLNSSGDFKIERSLAVGEQAFVDDEILINGRKSADPADGGYLLLLKNAHDEQGIGISDSGAININCSSSEESPSPAIAVNTYGNMQLMNLANKFVVDKDGKLGIGTDTPLTTLDVRGVANVAGMIFATQVDGAANDSGNIKMFSQDGATGRRPVLSFYPTFGSGGDTDHRLSANITGGFTGQWGTEYLTLNVGKGGAANDDGVLCNEAMRITSNGYVGIATTAPKSPLHVVGLPVYANNAAALAGGLTAGAFYRTGADPDPVCVVH